MAAARPVEELKPIQRLRFVAGQTVVPTPDPRYYGTVSSNSCIQTHSFSCEIFLCNKLLVYVFFSAWSFPNFPKHTPNLHKQKHFYLKGRAHCADINTRPHQHNMMEVWIDLPLENIKRNGTKLQVRSVVLILIGCAR